MLFVGVEEEEEAVVVPFLIKLYQLNAIGVTN